MEKRYNLDRNNAVETRSWGVRTAKPVQNTPTYLMNCVACIGLIFITPVLQITGRNISFFISFPMRRYTS
jgi:hypothetical protein